MSFKKRKLCAGKSRGLAEEIPEVLPSLRAFSRRLARRAEDAEDLVQDTVMSALKAEGTFDGANLRAWMFTIMRNRAINVQRKRAHRTRSEGLVSKSSCGVWAAVRPLPPDSGLDGEEVREALSTLRPERRDALVAFGLDGLSYKEIAEEIGRPIGTVMSRLHRARRSMAEAMPGL